MKPFLAALIPAALAAALVLAPRAAQAQATTGLVAFEAKCAGCHQTAAGAAAHAPDASKLRRMSTEAVYAALAKAPHTGIAGLAEEDKKLISAYLGGLKLGIAELADAKMMPNRCTASAPMGDISKGPAWTGWGNDPTSNARFQSASSAQLTAADVPKLKLKWAFGFPGADEAWSQPAIAAGRVFVGSDAGTVYSLDAATGCVYWSFQAEGGMRDVINIAPGSGATKYALYFGDMRANVYSLDAETGKQLWKVRIDDHPSRRSPARPRSTKAASTSRSPPPKSAAAASA